MKKSSKLLLFIMLIISTLQISAQNKLKGKIALSANYGIGYRTAKAKNTNAAEKEIIDQLRGGSTFDIKVGYQTDTKSYIGLTFSTFSSDATLSNLLFVEPNGTAGSGTIQNSQTINFIGIGGGLCDKGFLKNDTMLLDMYLGYIDIKSNEKYKNTYVTTGANLGISANLSYYFGINKHIKFGPSVSFSGGVLKQYTTTGSNYENTVKFPDNEGESLYRFNIMFGTYIQL